MKPLVIIVTASIYATVLQGCANTTTSSERAMRMHYPTIDFLGADADKLTIEDVRQIRELARSRADIQKPITLIYTAGPDRAEVQSGGQPRAHMSYFYTSFYVHRRGGSWIIEPGSIQKKPVIAVHSDEPSA
jgi:hypothetical protein